MGRAKGSPGSEGLAVAAAIGGEGAAGLQHGRRFLTTPVRVILNKQTHTHTPITTETRHVINDWRPVIIGTPIIYNNNHPDPDEMIERVSYLQCFIYFLRATCRSMQNTTHILIVCVSQRLRLPCWRKGQSPVSVVWS